VSDSPINPFDDKVPDNLISADIGDFTILIDGDHLEQRIATLRAWFEEGPPEEWTFTQMLSVAVTATSVGLISQGVPPHVARRTVMHPLSMYRIACSMIRDKERIVRQAHSLREPLEDDDNG